MADDDTYEVDPDLRRAADRCVTHHSTCACMVVGLIEELQRSRGSLERSTKLLEDIGPSHRCTMCSLEVRIPLAPEQMWDGCPQIGCAGKLEQVG